MSNSLAARLSSFPFLIPAHPRFCTVSAACPSNSGARRPGTTRQAGCASGVSAARASSKTATAISRLTEGKSSRKTASESPASRCSKRIRIGTRVPAKTREPPRISGSVTRCGVIMFCILGSATRILYRRDVRRRLLLVNVCPRLNARSEPGFASGSLEGNVSKPHSHLGTSINPRSR